MAVISKEKPNTWGKHVAIPPWHICNTCEKRRSSAPPTLEAHLLYFRQRLGSTGQLPNGQGELGTRPFRHMLKNIKKGKI